MGMAMTSWENSRAFRKDHDYGLENALAKHVRNRWPDKAIAYVQHEWDLSESEAAKVVYANASKNTLRKLMHHRRGGFDLFVQLLEDVTETKLADHIRQKAERAAHERRTWEAEERRLETLRSQVADVHSLDRRGAR